MENELLNTIFESIPLGLATILAISFILNRKVNKLSRLYLSLFFIGFVLIQFFLVFAEYTDDKYGKLLIPLIIGGALIIPPTLYAYVNSLILKQKKLNLKKHYVPSILFFILNLIIFSLIIFIKIDKEFESIISEILNYTTLFPLIIIFPVQSLYYIYQSFQSIKRHQVDIGEVYSYENGINLQWVKLFLAGFICWFILIVLDGIFNYQLNETNFFRQHVYDITTSFYILFIGVKALQQSAINNALSQTSNQAAKSIVIKEESLSEKEKFKEIKSKLDQYTNENQPYLDATLTIYDLAKVIETNYKYLSKTINTEYGQNFVSYINHFRIIEAKRLLKNPENNNYTIEAIGEMSGFKSKSAFNLAFKKITGYTPSVYKNKM